MPQYELMYILSSQVSDDQVPQIRQQVLKFVEDFGGTEIKENFLGKKKLAYPIKKTRNGNYAVVNFEMDSKNINPLDARIHSQDSNIIRYLITNRDEFLKRSNKDKASLERLAKRELKNSEVEEKKSVPEKPIIPEVMPVKDETITAAPISKEVNQAPKPSNVLDVSDLDFSALDKKIEAALNEDIIK